MEGRSLHQLSGHKQHGHGRGGAIRSVLRPRFTAAKAAALWLAVSLLAAGCAPTVYNNDAAVAVAPELTLRGYRADDAALLPLRFWGPDEPQAVVLGLHGFGDYANAFDDAADQLGKAGIRTYAYDQRGFGKTLGRGRWHGVGRMVQDAANATRLLQQRYSGKPVYLLGLSMGGAVAMVTAAEHPDLNLAGIALIAPAVWGRKFMPAFQRSALNISAHSLPWYPVTGQAIRVTPTDNIEMLRRLSRDPHILRGYRVDLIWGLTNMMDRAVAVAPRIKTPSLFLYGLRDELVPLNPTRFVLNQINPAYLRVGVYENGHHMLLRDLRGKVAVDDLAGWFTRRNRDSVLVSGADQDWQERLIRR
jgi:acylglycerol lipase